MIPNERAAGQTLYGTNGSSIAYLALLIKFFLQQSHL